jgi:hypothetical protein
MKFLKWLFQSQHFAEGLYATFAIIYFTLVYVGQSRWLFPGLTMLVLAAFQYTLTRIRLRRSRFYAETLAKFDAEAMAKAKIKARLPRRRKK